ncbi:tail fiber assembly protein [Pantoea dispersa]|uniref:tail fiber assembly protein n=1 Tax=Pantoea dispersa TaxID=59814 RepID=UPI002DBCECB3|nr:tail fiber assembly protein [Pantoea dispersa]MEB5973215.1 tail fiber assembly protein [Pantoea dispersa]
MAAYAIVDQNGNVINTVVWDGENDWVPPEGTTVIAAGDSGAGIGWTYKNGEFISPPIPVIPKEELVNQANQQKSVLLSEANTYTQPWQTQLMLGIITETDKELLTTWMKYYQQVQAVDTSTVPDITWPDKPVN